MHDSLFIRCIAEFIGTAIMVALGNGSVANVELKGTKGYHGSWLLIGWGYGIGVMIPALMFGTISGAQINPAMTIASAVVGNFPWQEVLPYVVAMTADKLDPRADFIGLGFLVMCLVVSLGGPTGPALNPARDLGPRLLHAIWPFPHKGSSQFEYSWVPVIAPIAGAICATVLWQTVFN
jgi:glycerol uptake facilitator protein